MDGWWVDIYRNGVDTETDLVPETTQFENEQDAVELVLSLAPDCLISVGFGEELKFQGTVEQVQDDFCKRG